MGYDYHWGTHESVHNLVSKNNFINDWLSEIFCSWPMLISMRSYRIKHLAHHAWLNTDDDPDFISKADENWQYPMMKYKFIRILITQDILKFKWLYFYVQMTLTANL